MISDTITPPRITSTATAAARVRLRKAMSPSRRRSSTLERDGAALVTACPPCSAMSATTPLPARPSRSLCSRGRNQAARSLENTRRNHAKTGGQGKGAAQRLLPRPCLRSVGHAVERLAARVLDLGAPSLLDILDHVGRHRHVVEFLGCLAALRIGPREEFQRFGGRGSVLRLLVDEDPGGGGHRPRGVAGLVRSEEHTSELHSR